MEEANRLSRVVEERGRVPGTPLSIADFCCERIEPFRISKGNTRIGFCFHSEGLSCGANLQLLRALVDNDFDRRREEWCADFTPVERGETPKKFVRVTVNVKQLFGLEEISVNYLRVNAEASGGT